MDGRGMLGPVGYHPLQPARLPTLRAMAFVDVVPSLRETPRGVPSDRWSRSQWQPLGPDVGGAPSWLVVSLLEGGLTQLYIWRLAI